MNQLLQMIFSQKMSQLPQGIMKQLEQQLKRVNPQAYQEFQQARKNNDDPKEYLNKVTNNFSEEQKQQWSNMINGINTK